MAAAREIAVAGHRGQRKAPAAIGVAVRLRSTRISRCRQSDTRRSEDLSMDDRNRGIDVMPAMLVLAAIVIATAMWLWMMR